MSIGVTAANRNKNFAGAVPVVFKSVKSALKRINGESAMDLPGSVLIVNESE